MGNTGLCFQYETGFFSHREFRGLAPFSVQMDLQNVKPVSGFVFTHVANSSFFGRVCVYYDVESQFTAQRFETIDLSTLSASRNSVEMFFKGDPVRARYVRIILEEYPDLPPCLMVAPIICLYFCVGCCQTVQAVDVTTLPVLALAAEVSTINTPQHVTV